MPISNELGIISNLGALFVQAVSLLRDPNKRPRDDLRQPVDDDLHWRVAFDSPMMRSLAPR
jgi:hypothetical protein